MSTPPDTTSSALEGLEELLAAADQPGAMADFPSLLSRMLAALLPIVGAERGRVFIREPQGSFRVFVQTDQSPSVRELPVSQTLLARVLREGRPLLLDTFDLASEAAVVGSLDESLRSILCVPVGSGGEAAGVLYLDSRVERRAFSEKDRSLLATFTRIAARGMARAAERDELANDLERYRRLAADEGGEARVLVGGSPAMKKLLGEVRTLGAEETTVLITGESGTGKELIARAVHDASARRARPFVPVHCMALSRELVESELFGHEKGAFSGAVARRVGRFELAQGGTLFLDEIGELSLDVQVKLLRVLQERLFERVGGTQTVRLDARLVLATNIDLEEAVAKGKFREDLYYRINVFRLRLPALRERREDVEALARHFVEHFNGRMRKKIKGISPEAVTALRAHGWPGNIRELRNVVEQAFLRATGDTIEAGALGLTPPARAAAALAAGTGEPSYPAGLEEAKKLFEARHISRHLEQNGFNVMATARQLDTTKVNIYRKMKEYGIHRPGPPTPEDE
ncbi:MAG: sigma-54-dependent Fis family transcriptional regulator [Candidatus Wallbacteria bacterium]|nr:sigma-54-dependent Fis family transcriptional regulator [Candidatus Wallbacteria bacterium]